MNSIKVFRCTIPKSKYAIKDTVINVLRYVESIFGVLTENITFELKVILNELLLNSIKYSGRDNIEQKIQIVVGYVDQCSIFIVIEDEGEGYDFMKVMNQRTDVPCDVCDIKENGRGIFIVQSLCEKIKFNQKGNKIVIVKKVRSTLL